MRVRWFYFIQTTPDGISLEMVNGANKQVQLENLVRFGSVLGRHWHISGWALKSVRAR